MGKLSIKQKNILIFPSSWFLDNFVHPKSELQTDIIHSGNMSDRRRLRSMNMNLIPRA